MILENQTIKVKIIKIIFKLSLELHLLNYQ